MKKIALTLLIICSISPLLHAQNFELSVGANSGWFTYGGSGATANTGLMAGANSSENYVLDPYGSKYAFSYGAFLQPQYVFKSNFIIGLQGSYDVLRSKNAITGVYPYGVTYDNYYGGVVAQPSTGTDVLQSQEINLNPYIGYRINAGAVKLDVMPGLSFGFDFNAREKGKASITGDTQSSATYESNNKLTNQHTDTQLKLGLAAAWQRWALVGSYAYGLSNISPLPNYNNIHPDAVGSGSTSTDYTSPQGKICTSLFRLGISYRLFSAVAK